MPYIIAPLLEAWIHQLDRELSDFDASKRLVEMPCVKLGPTS